MLHQNQQNINDIIIYCTIKGENIFFFCDKMTNFISKKNCVFFFSHITLLCHDVTSLNCKTNVYFYLNDSYLTYS